MSHYRMASGLYSVFSAPFTKDGIQAKPLFLGWMFFVEVSAEAYPKAISVEAAFLRMRTLCPFISSSKNLPVTMDYCVISNILPLPLIDVPSSDVLKSGRL